MSKNNPCRFRTICSKFIKRVKGQTCQDTYSQDRITDGILSEALKPNYTPSEELNQSILEKMKNIC